MTGRSNYLNQIELSRQNLIKFDEVKNELCWKYVTKLENGLKNVIELFFKGVFIDYSISIR